MRCVPPGDYKMYEDTSVPIRTLPPRVNEDFIRFNYRLLGAEAGI